ncbi:hypothetical protein B7463_g1728, partial [Scytalidium lignicola]
MYLSTGDKLVEISEKHGVPLVVENRNPQRTTMSRVNRFLLGFLVLSVLTFTLISASADSRSPSDLGPAITNEQQEFQRLLNSVEPATLHEVLHKHLKDKFKHGVYSEDRAALEAVHKTNAAVATSLVELAKRQTGGSTTNGTISSASSASTTGAASSIPPSEASSSPPSPSSTSTGTPTSAGSSAPPPSSTTSSTPASTPSSSATTSSTRSPSSTSSEPERSSSTAETTAPPRFTTSKVIITSTLPGGDVSTVTQLTIVAATGDSTAPPGAKTTVDASLQSNSAGKNMQNLGSVVVIGGVAGMVALGLI